MQPPARKRRHVMSHVMSGDAGLSSTIYSYSGVLADLETISTGIGPSGLSAAQAENLAVLLRNVGAGDGTRSYVYSILNDVVATAGTGTSQREFNTLLGQWFLGTDNPTPLAGDVMVNNPGAPLFPTAMATAFSHIDQGFNNGDCWLVAALIETAAVNPAALQSMLWQNANGTYGVRFYAPNGYVYLTVDAELMSNDDGATSTDGSIWAGILEKAFVEAQADGISFPMNDGNFYTTDYPNDYNVVSNGGWDQMLKAITGRNTDYYQLSSQAGLGPGGSVYNQLLADTQNGIDVLFDSNTDTNYGLVADHMFAVTGIDQTTGNYMLFNPWGNAETPDAQFEITPAELNALYTGGTGDEFLAADGAHIFSEAALCHLSGTNILTATGERPIESLQIGDVVITRFGGTQRIKWIGEQHYAARFIAKNRDKIPVKITQGALGNNLPQRDLYLSPGHSLLLDDILVLARDLVNGVTITQAEPSGIISYYNIELAAHDCVLAEGSWSETYADCANLRGGFHNAASYWALHPRTAAPADPVLCAPRPRWGDAFTAAMARVLNLAEVKITPGPTIGYVEQIGDDITGWAFDPDHPDLPLRLHIYAGWEMIGLCFAHEERLDLCDAGFGSGRSGFRCPLPATADPARITVRRAASGEIVPVLAALEARRRAG
jgi:Hint domain/Calpain family cysteine protease